MLGEVGVKHAVCHLIFMFIAQLDFVCTQQGRNDNYVPPIAVRKRHIDGATT